MTAWWHRFMRRAEKATEPPSGGGDGAVVLIVEDNASLALALAEELLEAGYRVLGPTVGMDDTVALLARSVPDLALVDIGLEGRHDGVDVARVLGQYRVPVVFATGRATDDVLRRIAEVQAFGYLTKPIERPALLEAVSLALHRAAFEKTLRLGNSLLMVQRPVVGDQLTAKIVIDSFGRVLQWSEGAEIMFGWKSAACIGAKVADLIIPSDLRDRHRSAIAAIVAGAKPRWLGQARPFNAVRANGDRIRITLTLDGWQDQVTHVWYFAATITRREGET